MRTSWSSTPCSTSRPAATAASTAAVAAALERNARYIGAVGAKRTAERRRARLAEQGFSDEQIGRIHGPAGLDLGGRAPAQVALAIAAEIIAETSGGVKKDEAAVAAVQ